MIEYANDSVIKLLKQYDMFAKSLNYIDDIEQKNDVCHQMTKIIEEVLEITSSIYEKKYRKILSRSVYLMEDEKNRLLELVNLINERRAYINNQITSHQELTGIVINTYSVPGEENLEKYKENIKIIERYKTNIRMESVLKEEIESLDETIKTANEKINNNKNLNRQLEDRMIRIVSNALEKLSLYDLTEREKEIDLAYAELGYSLEKAKKNAKLARKEGTEEIILECDNILASTTVDYERYKEKKLILQLMYIYQKPVQDYESLLEKRENINNILLNITESELYSIIGQELNKEYSTIKLEAQDVATLKSLIEERELKKQKLRDVAMENSSDTVQGLLSSLLENEKKYQKKLEEEKKRKEKERIEREKLLEKKKLEEMAKKQKELEEERKKEIEMRTKQLLDEKKNSVLFPKEEEKQPIKKVVKTMPPKEEIKTVKKLSNNNSLNKINNNSPLFTENKDVFNKREHTKSVVNEGIPIVKNNSVISAKKQDKVDDTLFPSIPLDKKENIFPDNKDRTNNSFFDEDEFKDLSNYLDQNKKKDSWF